MKIKKWLLVTLALSMGMVHAGREGNGGFTYKCGDKVELVDLKEVEVIPYLNERLSIVRSNGSQAEILDEKIKKIELYYPETAAEIRKFVTSINFQVMSFDSGFRNDLGYHPTIPGCKVIPMIQYKDSYYADVAYLNDHEFFKLPEYDKAALLIHEALYKKARIAMNHYSKFFKPDDRYVLTEDGSIPFPESYERLTNSLVIRRLVAVLFSENFDENIKTFKELMDSYLFPFSRNIPKEIKFKVCMDKRFHTDGEKHYDLKKYLRNVSIEIEESVLKSNGTYTLAHKKKYRTPKGQYEEKQVRCDGTPGISYVITTDLFTVTSISKFYLSNFVEMRLLKTASLNLKLKAVMLDKNGTVLSTRHADEVFAVKEGDVFTWKGYNDLFNGSCDWCERSSMDVSTQVKSLSNETRRLVEATTKSN